MARAATREELDDVAVALAERPDAGEALDRLAECSCDRARLLELLVKIRRASTKTLFSREELQTAARALKTASLKLHHLSEWDQARYLGLQDDAGRLFREMSGELAFVAAKIREKLPEAGKKKRVYFSKAKARIVEHVMIKTGQPHDGPVALLIEAASGDVYDSESHRKWRKRNKSKFCG